MRRIGRIQTGDHTHDATRAGRTIRAAASAAVVVIGGRDGIEPVEKRDDDREASDARQPTDKPAHEPSGVPGRRGGEQLVEDDDASRARRFQNAPHLEEVIAKTPF